jgi:hypothetical protein
MRHMACASWCSSCARASLEAADSFTCGFSTMRENAPLPLSVSNANLRGHPEALILRLAQDW